MFAAELSVLATAVAPPVVLAAEMTGKFCKLFGPVSASPASLAVTPSVPRSMPSITPLGFSAAVVRGRLRLRFVPAHRAQPGPAEQQVLHLAQHPARAHPLGAPFFIR